MEEPTVRERVEAGREMTGLSVGDLWWRYFSLGGTLSQEQLGAFLAGQGAPGLPDADLLIHALNERFAEDGHDHPLGYTDDEEDPGGDGDTVHEVRLAAAVKDAVPRLLAAATRVEPGALATLVSVEARRAGLDEAVILLVDHEQEVLSPLGPASGTEPAAVDGTMAGRAYQSERPVTAAREGGGWTIWLPLLDGVERLGVLQLRSPFLSERLLDRARELASAVAELVVSKMQYGDALVLARRRQEMTLTAELRWPLLPPLTFTDPRVGIACVLEPAYDVAGDAFDYAMDEGVLHFAIFDAMGHELEATQMASLALGAYRSSRRRGLDLGGTFRYIDQAIARRFGSEAFVTGQLARLDSRSGLLRWVSAGHPYPLLLRHGRVASELTADPVLPMGLGDEHPSEYEVSLEPGDRLLFFTDGVVEARSPGEDRFGQGRLVDLAVRAMADQQTLAETARRLVRSVRLHREGPLEDDATLLFISWDGG